MSDKSDKDNLIPSIAPAQDEVASYRRSGRSESPRQVNFNGMLVFVIVILAIFMAVGGFALYQVQQRLEQSNKLLSKGQENIRMLEDRLKATGTDVSKTLQIMQGRLDTSESEIRKLWDVSNKRNKELIRANESAIAGLKSSNSSMDNRVDTVENHVGQVVTKFNQLAEQMTTLRRNLIDENEEMTTQVSLLRGQVQDQSVQMEANARTISRLEQQVKENQESIAVIDKYRQQINQRLMELQAQVQGTAGSMP